MAKEATMLLSVAQNHMKGEDDESAQTAATDALAIFREKGDKTGIADALSIVVKCYSLQGKTGEALSLAKEELAAFQKAKDQLGEGKMLLAIAGCVKNSEEALQSAKEAKDLFRTKGADKSEALAFLAMSSIYAKMSGQEAKKDAVQAASEAVELYKKSGDSVGEGTALCAVAAAKAADGLLADAVAAAEEVAHTFMEAGEYLLEASVFKSMAEWYMAGGKPLKAMHCAEEALELLQDHGGKEIPAMSIIIRCQLAKGQTYEAIKDAKAAVDKFSEAGDAKSEVAALGMLCSAYVANGDDEEATATMEKSLEMASEMGNKTMQAQLLNDASAMYYKAGQLDRAIEEAKKALESAQDMKSWTEVAQSLKSLVEAYIASDEAAEAVAVSKEIREILEKSGDAKAECSALLVTAQAQSAAGAPDLASAAAKMAGEIAYQEEDEYLEGLSLDVLCDVYMNAEKYEKAARAGEQARRIWRSLEKFAHEVNALNQVAQAYINQGYKKAESGKALTGKDSAVWEKALKSGTDCLSLSKELPPEEGPKVHQANAQSVLSQVYLARKETEEALAAASEAVSLFKSEGVDRGEAYAAVLVSQAHIQDEKYDKAKKSANDGMKLFKKSKDERGMSFAQSVLDLIEKLAPPPPPPQMMMMGGPMPGQWKMPGGKMPQMQQEMMDPGAGGSIQRAGGGVGALDMSSGVDVDVISGKVMEIAKTLVDEEAAEEIEGDIPLMEAGITSNTAVVLRDEIMNAIPGIQLPPTLIFDYPSITGIAEFIVEKLG